MYLSFHTSDTIREVPRESTAFLGDAYTLAVREGESRWGAPRMLDATSASWEVDGGARVTRAWREPPGAGATAVRFPALGPD